MIGVVTILEPTMTVTSTSALVHTCAAEPIFTLRSHTTNHGWTTLHIYVGGDFLFSVGAATHETQGVHHGRPGETAQSIRAEAIRVCDAMPTMKLGKCERDMVARVRARKGARA